MGRESARAEAKFNRGETGVDGQATAESKDEVEVELEQGKAREQLFRGRSYLGREFLTWLLWRSESGEPLLQQEKVDLHVLFAGRVVLRAGQGEITELTAKGANAPYSELVRQALDRGLLVHSARLRFTAGEKVFEATLDAEFLDVRSAKLPALLSEEADDRSSERLYLVEQLSGMVTALVEQFLALRTGRSWAKKVVPELKAWMKGESERAGMMERRARTGS